MKFGSLSLLLAFMGDKPIPMLCKLGLHAWSYIGGGKPRASIHAVCVRCGEQE